VRRRRSGWSRRRFLRCSALGAGLATFAPHSRPGRTATIRTRPIPSTGERIPIVGLGTYRSFDIAPGAGRSDQREVLRRFFATGARVVDSSPMYGESERVVGELAADLGIADELFMATKVWTRGRASGIRQMARSEALLRTDRIDLMQVHNLVDLRTQLATLREWKAEGRIRYVGITHYTSSMHDTLAELVESEPLDFVQFNYNVADRHAERRLLPAARERGVAALVNEPFETGALFGRLRGKTLPDWVRPLGVETWAQFLLKFILAEPAVTCAIPATSDPEHVVDNTQAAFGPLPERRQRDRMAAWIART